MIQFILLESTRFTLKQKSKLKLKPVKTDNDQLQLLMAGKLDKMNKGKDGIIYHELYRGDMSQKDYAKKISDSMTVLTAE